MRILKKVSAFLLAFVVLSASIAGVCAAVDEPKTEAIKETLFSADEQGEDMVAEFDEPAEETEKAPTDEAKSVMAVTGAASSYTPRLTAPAKTNGYYYSNKNVFYAAGWGMPNCTCYAYGRAYEILGTKPNLCIYSAYLWYDYNKQNGYYAYGQTPKVGAIACWVYSSGTSGHVAVVEKISNNTITFSNSAYGGSEFYTSTAPVNDPSNGRSTWIFQGYIYIGNYSSSSSNPETPTTATNQAEEMTQAVNITGDTYRITSKNGVNLRSGAGTSFVALTVIPYGADTVVNKTRRADGYTWGYTTYNGKTGWFVLDYAKLVYTNSSSGLLAPSYLVGDVDGDKKVTITDATLIQRVMAKIEPLTEYIAIVGDFDGNNRLEVADATKLQIHLTK